MDLQNIKMIIVSFLWRQIKENSHFLDFKIVHTTETHPDHFCALYIFFDNQISEDRLKRFWREARQMTRTEGINPYTSMYGYTKILVFS